MQGEMGVSNHNASLYLIYFMITTKRNETKQRFSRFKCARTQNHFNSSDRCRQQFQQQFSKSRCQKRGLRYGQQCGGSCCRNPVRAASSLQAMWLLQLPCGGMGASTAATQNNVLPQRSWQGRLAGPVQTVRAFARIGCIVGSKATCTSATKMATAS